MGLSLTHDIDHCLHVGYDGVELLRYVYRPSEAQLESPRPYFHPLRTLAGDLVSVYRPHDHVWHKGIALSLPNVGAANLWGGATYVRDRGYTQLPNNGSMRHTGFSVVQLDSRVRVEQSLDWVTQQGETWFTEERSISVEVHPSESAWVLGFATSFTNVSGDDVAIGSPTTEGRDNAGYGGLFWRGPRDFTGGDVTIPGQAGGDDLMGVRAEWMAFTGRHDGSGRTSTIVMVDAPGNPDHPVQWFVRSTPFAALCPAPFFSTATVARPGDKIQLRYAVVIGTTAPPSILADLGRSSL